MAKQNIIIVDAPSNLGLRPPEEGVIPGCYKLPWALRDRNLLNIIGADDGGSVIPPRYQSQWKAGDGDRNAQAISEYSTRLATRLQPLIKNYRKTVVLGGDCSILIGSMMALKRLGRYGLIFLDAHSDFRNPENSENIGAAAGEDLAIVTGRGDARLVNIEGLEPYLRDDDVQLIGVRNNDDYLNELRAKQIPFFTSQQLIEKSAEIINKSLERVTKNTVGFWIHLDLDVVDSSEMPAVDCPEADGPSFSLLADLLHQLLNSPQCVGIEITIYDPDLDPLGVCADRIMKCLQTAFSDLAGLSR